ncbi:MAG: DNA primase [Muribaculaceae bacterium]|nr:DNA primase [Muribaculaceae bacterium]
MIDKATVQKIKDTADIVEVVSDYVHLTRRGANYIGLCPFHNERTPSFSVNKSRNFCYCFSCHKGGSPVNFVMEKEGISYHDALLHLAKKYGIKVEERELSDEEREAQSRREGMFIANEWAMNHFEKNLTETQDGRDIGLQYLYGRGVTQEAVRQFHLGYALDRGSAFLEAATKKGFNTEVLKALGLVGTSQQGRDYDRFRGRVIFPILNSSGKVVAFGGRDLKGGPAKYINSPESDLYKKSNELYGMYQARSAIVKEDKCYLVEGYLDVIGMWQSGMKNVVASSGTALTDGQIALIHRFTKNVTLIYDGDAAGIKASLRGIDMLLSHQLDVNVLLLPDGDDPDSFARKHTPEEFREYVSEHETDIIRFKTKVLMDDVNDNPQKRVEAIRSVVSSLACIPDKVKRDVYIQECSRLLGVSEESVGSATATARAAIVEQLKKQRTIREINRDIPDNGGSPSYTASVAPGSAYPAQASPAPNQGTPSTQPVSPANTPQAHRPATRIQFREQSPLRPMEWKVLQYCIRYGFLDFCQDDNTGAILTVVEYVADELAADSTGFSVGEYADTFRMLTDLLPHFKEELGIFREKLQSEKNDRRQDGYRIIGEKQLSVSEIQREEQKLEENLDNWEDEQVLEFSRAYPSKELASHENGVVRHLTTEAITEPHQLSHIYSRERPVEKEEDKLISLLPTAIYVWKNGILDIQLKDLMSKFREISGKGILEEEQQIQMKIAELMSERSELAKNIGDRILCPGSTARRQQSYRI